jgi:hypothetical protein
MLADEAEPAQIDSHDMIARAKARTRTRRATIAAAVATFAVVGALVATMTNARPAKPATTTTAVPPSATLSELLDNQLKEALPDVIPTGWSLVTTAADSSWKPLTFMCGGGCLGGADFNDGVGDIDMNFNLGTENDPAANGFSNSICGPPECINETTPVEHVLPDGTRAQLATFTETPTSRDIQEMLVSRPDGTHMRMTVLWPTGSRSAPPLTTDELLKFATVFSYDRSLPAGKTWEDPNATLVPEDKSRAARVNEDLVAALNKVIPAGWERDSYGFHGGADQPFSVSCSEITWVPGRPDENGKPPTSTGCWAAGNYVDGTGKIGFKFSVSRQPLRFDEPCAKPGCVEKKLKDGTKARVWTATEPDAVGEYDHELSAVRADGTCVWVQVHWKDQRDRTPLTDDELLRFATAFTY